MQISISLPDGKIINLTDTGIEGDYSSFVNLVKNNLDTIQNLSIYEKLTVYMFWRLWLKDMNEKYHINPTNPEFSNVSLADLELSVINIPEPLRSK